MTRDSFLDRIDDFATYTDRFERITLFEITQYFGSTLFLVIAWFLSLPLFILNYSLLIIPLSAFNITCFIWYYFDQKIWIPDFVKKQTISSSSIKLVLNYLSNQIKRLQASQKRFLPYWNYAHGLGIVLCCFAEFRLGFIPTTSIWPAFSLFLMIPGLLFKDCYLLLLGFLFFFL